MAASKSRLRASFAKIAEPLEVPNLLALQTASFDRLVGNETWKTRVAGASSESRIAEVAVTSGLEEIFEEISPIEDFNQTMSLSFRDHRFEPPKYSVEECKDKDMTYAAPLFVTAEFTNNTTGEIKSQTVFMGDFPLMTEKGTFVINGTERVVVSQLVRSPGVYFDKNLDKTSDKDVFTCKVIPSRGAWLEFEVDKRDSVGVRVDRKRKQPVTVLLKALGWDDARILERWGDFESMRITLEKDHTAGQDEALLDIYRKLRPGEPPTRESAQTLLENLFFNPSATTWTRSAATRSTRSCSFRSTRPTASSPRTTSSPPSTTSCVCTPVRPTSRLMTSTTSATVASARSANSFRTRSARAWAGWSASSASG